MLGMFGCGFFFICVLLGLGICGFQDFCDLGILGFWDYLIFGFVDLGAFVFLDFWI